MEVSFQLNETDYVSANLAYFRRRWWPLLYGYRLPIGIAVIAFAVILQHPESGRDVVGLFAVGIGLIAYILITYRWTWRRRYEAFGQRTVSATIDRDSIRFHGGRQEVVRGWTEFADIHETNRIFLFEMRNRRVFFLPKSAMNQTQINELRNLISANAKGKVKLEADSPQ